MVRNDRVRLLSGETKYKAATRKTRATEIPATEQFTDA